MAAIDRRMALSLGIGAAAAATFPAAALGSSPAAPGITPIEPSNPLAVRMPMHTIVVADIGAGIAFYGDLMGYRIVQRGTVGRDVRIPGLDGRMPAYALLRHGDNPAGIIRLVEAPKGAIAIRPAAAGLVDPGLASLAAISSDVDRAWRTLTGAGFRSLSPPTRYRFDRGIAMNVLPGTRSYIRMELSSCCVFGPGGEALFISTGHTLEGKPWPVKPDAPVFGAFQLAAIQTLDRWPAWDFYERVFGILPVKDVNADDDGLARAMGLPAGAYLRFGSIGAGVPLEWWEYRQARAPGHIHATSLDRTGLAMETFTVDDLIPIRERVRKADIPVLATTGLPGLDAKAPPALILRGAVGELIEVVAR